MRLATTKEVTGPHHVHFRATPPLEEGSLMGARRTLRWKGYEVTLEVPEAVAQRLRNLRKGSPEEPQDGNLEFMQPLPPLHVQPRDPVRTLDMIRLPEGV